MNNKKHTQETIDKIKATRNYDFAARTVITPLGKFKSINAAAKAHKCTAPNIFMKIKRGTEGYSYEKP